jgi:hypothetical protein
MSRFALIVPHYGSDHAAIDFINDFECYSRSSFTLVFVSNQPISKELRLYCKSIPRLRLLEELKPGSYFARNYAIKQCGLEYELLCFTDSDCVLRENYYSSVESNSSKIIDQYLVAGDISIYDATGDANSWVLSYEKIFEFDQKWTTSKKGGVTANLIVNPNLFNEVGLFNDDLKSGADNAFCKHAAENHHKVVFMPEILIKHPSRGTLKDLIYKSRRTYGGWYQLLGFKSGNIFTKIYSVIYIIRPPIKPLYRIIKHQTTTTSEKIRAVIILIILRVARVIEHFRLLFGHSSLR